jgi:undecaprenyl-diphosphatase
MDIFAVVVLSIVEGITEFLPISSTGHLMAVAALLKLPPSEFLKSFEIFIQLGAIAAVSMLYTKKIFRERWIVLKVLTAFVPTAIIGLVFYPFVKTVLLENLPTVATALFVGGLVLIAFEYWIDQRGEATVADFSQLSYKQSFIIGLCQSLALIPGVSRSGATIVSGLSLGLARPLIVEFSFLLAIPTMVAAVGYDIVQSGFNFTAAEFGYLLLGFVLSFVFSLIAVRWLLKYIQTHNFIWFGLYRILAAGLIWLFIL